MLNYAKCYARLALNSNTAKELRFAMKFQNYIVEGEMELHRAILSLGINADELDIKDESLVNIAYSRYMLSVGENGDFLDMLVALSALFFNLAQIFILMLVILNYREVKYFLKYLFIVI